MKYIYTLIICSVLTAPLVGQKSVGRNINSKIDVEMYPSVSADGRIMTYLRKYRMGARWVLIRTKQVQPNVWNQGIEVPVYNKNIDLHYTGSHFMTYDDQGIYYSTKKAPGVGGYDIV